MMKKWIFIAGVFIVILTIGASAFAYQTIRAPLDDLYVQAESYALSHELSTIINIDYYHGTTAYFVVNGTDEKGLDVIMWITDDLSSHHNEFSSDGITAEKALMIAQNEVAISHVQSIRLGFERGLPVYEVTYKNEENNQGYYYLTFKDGTFVKRYQLRAD